MLFKGQKDQKFEAEPEDAIAQSPSRKPKAVAYS